MGRGVGDGVGPTMGAQEGLREGTSVGRRVGAYRPRKIRSRFRFRFGFEVILEIPAKESGRFAPLSPGWEPWWVPSAGAWARLWAPSREPGARWGSHGYQPFVSPKHTTAESQVCVRFRAPRVAQTHHGRRPNVCAHRLLSAPRVAQTHHTHTMAEHRPFNYA
jgi:hypothetical protein